VTRVYDDISLGCRVDELALPGVRLSEVTYAAGTELPPHAHRNANVTLVLSGGFEESVDGHTYEAYPGSVVLKPAGTVHSNRFREGSRSFLVELTADPAVGLGPFSACRWLSHGPASRLALSLYALFREPEARSAGGVRRALAELVRGAADTVSAVARPDGGRLAEVQSLLETEGEPTRVGDVARTIGLHPVHLARAFRRRFGCTPREYRQRWRVRRALSLLATTDAPLPSVALASGFCDQSHLCRGVRRQLGLTPSAFRRAVRQHQRKPLSRVGHRVARDADAVATALRPRDLHLLDVVEVVCAPPGRARCRPSSKPAHPWPGRRRGRRPRRLASRRAHPARLWARWRVPGWGCRAAPRTRHATGHRRPRR